MLAFMRRGRKKKASKDAMEVEEASKAGQVEEGVQEGEEEEEKVDHSLEVAQLRFKLQCEKALVPDQEQVRQEVVKLIREKNMVGYYKQTCELGLAKTDSQLLKQMEEENKKIEEELAEDEKDAEENHGEIEVMEALLRTASFRALTGTKQDALDAYGRVAELKSMSTGQLIDVVLRKIRLGFFWMDLELVKASIAEAEKLLEKGGDWDRRNRLKVYRGLFSLVSRNFAKASEDFLSAVATFTSTELCSYEMFIFYTIMTSVVALDRVQFKKKVIDSPEVRSVVRDIPFLFDFMNDLHECNYKGFFEALVQLNPKICANRYLSIHKDWFFREVRVLAYKQFLESYKSVTLKSMAKSFGVSEVFLDKELSHFISSRRINAKIDKVAGVIETCQPNEANARYQSVIRQGDLLLNRVQMLSRAINV